ncbi:MAG: hypothetical protein GY851_08220, partial [bacterium]|nr:hypothetical protein [bacterium]
MNGNLVGPMRSVALAVVLFATLTAFSGTGHAQDVALEPYVYHEGFEGDAQALDQWADNGPCEIAYSGTTDEQAFEGKRSYKLDVTVKGGSYHYFGVPVYAACMGDLKMTARVYVSDETTADVGFGTNVMYPPTRHSGCGPAVRYTKPTDGWQLVECDLVERGRDGAGRVMATQTATKTAEDVGVTLDCWSLFIYGGEGARAVVYIDDIRIEGQTPTKEAFDVEVARRWETARERLAERLARGTEELASARREMAQLEAQAGTVTAPFERVTANLDKAEALVKKALDAGYTSRTDLEEIRRASSATGFGASNLRTLVDGAREGRPFLLFMPPAITNREFTTDAFPIPARRTDGLACAACRSEYESVTLVVYALADLEDVLVTVGDLRAAAGTIPAAAVDVSIVKCWYQAGRGIRYKPNREVFVPELLLKDDALVRVDRGAKENRLRSTAEDGTERYVLCSDPTSEALEGVRPVDAAALQPVAIPAGTLRQYWLTVRVPDDAQAGTYKGEVTLSSNAGNEVVPFEVTVHPFELAASSLTYSIYYRAKLSKDGAPTIGSEDKSEEQFRAELADMAAHGVPYATNYQTWEMPRLRRVLEIRRELGLPTDRFYNLGRTTGSPESPQQLARLSKDIGKWIALCGEFGYEDVYFYGIDEARDERLAAQRVAWKAVQDAGGKTFVACYHKTFEAMGSLLDCAVLANRPDPEEARKWHSVGSEAFCYAYP